MTEKTKPLWVVCGNKTQIESTQGSHQRYTWTPTEDNASFVCVKFELAQRDEAFELYKEMHSSKLTVTKNWTMNVN